MVLTGTGRTGGIDTTPDSFTSCLAAQGADFLSPCRGAKNREELNRLLTSHIMLRRLKKDVLSQIPALQRSRISVLPDPKKLKVSQNTHWSAYCEDLGAFLVRTCHTADVKDQTACSVFASC